MPTVTEEAKYVIYGLKCTCCPLRGIRYVGLTTRGISMRLADHRSTAASGMNRPVYSWMRKHGPRNIVAQVLEEHDDIELLKAAEIRLIEEMGTHISAGGTNLGRGGEARFGVRHSPESRRKMSESRTGRDLSPQHRARLVEAAPRGEAHHSAKLSESDVVDIKARLWDGDSLAAIARQYGVSHATVSGISHEKAWRHVPWPTNRPRSITTLSVRHSALPDSLVREIRAWRSSGLLLADIAERAGVSSTTAWLIITGERYAHVA